MRRLLRNCALFFVSTVLSLAGLATLLSAPALGANFTMKTGYYIGSGSSGKAISGLGFQPDFILIKSSTAAGAAVFKTSAMPASVTAFTSGAADDTGTNITITSNGFTLGTLANVNSANVLYNYIAVGGSDCSATGNFCVGTYTGTGTASRNITVGFQAAMAMVKRSTAVEANYRVASEPANESLYFTGTARNTTGQLISGFTATAFTVGATNDASGGTFYYAAFSTTANAFAVGTYTGNGTDNVSITSVGFRPNFVLVKNATGNNAMNRSPVMNFTESYGDNSNYVGIASANMTDGIQSLLSNGFQVGAANQTNMNTNTFYYFAFGGAAADSTSGSFSMATGSYTGTGVSNPVSGLGFRPELVMVKAATAQLGVFRTSLMAGDSTAYFSNAVTNFTGGITSLDNDGFTVGNAAQTNTLNVTYHWQAFGNAYDPDSKTGSSDFAVGAYYGNGIARSVTNMPWQPDMIAAKRLGASAGVWRSTANSGDSTSLFGATADTAGMVASLNSDGFSVGTNAAVNTAAELHHWFAFKAGANFAVGSYTGTAAAQSITSAGLRPENIWIKRSTAVSAVQKPITLAGDNTQYFTANANVADRITGFVKNGFTVGGNQTETNATAATYRYAAWSDSDHGTLSLDIVNSAGASVASPSYAMSNLAYGFTCRTITGTLGTASQKIRISNLTNSASWSVSIAASNGNADLWKNGGNTEQYDFNDSTGSGCSDGGDADSKAGQLFSNASSGTITPEAGCTSSNITLNGSTGFQQGVVDAVGLVSANGSANADCIWDITNIDLNQVIPSEQPIGEYTINLTITIVAS